MGIMKIEGKAQRYGGGWIKDETGGRKIGQD